jgi:hypothetical protein
LKILALTAIWAIAAGFLQTGRLIKFIPGGFPGHGAVGFWADRANWLGPLLGVPVYTLTAFGVTMIIGLAAAMVGGLYCPDAASVWSHRSSSWLPVRRPAPDGRNSSATGPSCGTQPEISRANWSSRQSPDTKPRDRPAVRGGCRSASRRARVAVQHQSDRNFRLVDQDHRRGRSRRGQGNL